MSVYDDIAKRNALSAEERRRSEAAHMAERQKQATRHKPTVVTLPAPDAQEAKRKRVARWKVLAEKSAEATQNDNVSDSQ